MWKRRSLAIAVLLVAGVYDAAGAQARLSVLTGQAVDSLRGGPLAGAYVAVRNTNRVGVTDSAGRFTVDSVPPGTYRIVLHHPRLDSLGVLVTTPDVVFAPNDTVSVALGIPSDRTLVRAKCANQASDSMPAAIAGVVTDSDSELPAADATVTVTWTEWRVGSADVGGAQRRRTAVTNANGAFAVCGLPRELTAEVRARRGADMTGVIPVQVRQSVLHILPLSLPSSAVQGRATLTGRISGAGGAPVVGARVQIAGAPASTLSDERGEFTLQELPSGSQRLVVRRVGYLPVERSVVLSAQRPARIEVTMGEAVTVLDEVRVNARMNDALERVGFSGRRRAGQGRYMTAADITEMRPRDLSDVLANAGPLRRVFVRGRPVIVGRYRGRGFACVRYFVDGLPWRGASPVDLMRPEEIGAVEIYSSTTTPSEFGVLGGDCETVVIWTKPLLGVPN